MRTSSSNRASRTAARRVPRLASAVERKVENRVPEPRAEPPVSRMPRPLLGQTLSAQTQIAYFQTQLRRLNQDKQQLEQRVEALTRENRLWRLQSARLPEHSLALRSFSNQQRHQHFWGFHYLFAHCPGFEAYAESVDYDPTRLFVLALLTELNASDAGPDITGHADAIADLFDPFFYLAEYQDVAIAAINPLEHYVTVGYRERLRPNPLFDPDYYRAQSAVSRGDLLWHYIDEGAAEGLKPHPLFDGRFYQQRNPELPESIAESEINPLFHYQLWGARAGLDPSPVFDTEYYLSGEPAGPLGDNPLHDYLARGDAAPDPHPLFSGRYFRQQVPGADLPGAPLAVYEGAPELWGEVRPHPLFDTGYLAQIGAAEFPPDSSPLASYCELLADSDVDPTVLFDSALYRYQVEQEHGRALIEPPIFDYLKRGYSDPSLRPNLLFDPAVYSSANGIDVEGPALVHYVLTGDRKGYECHPLFSAGTYNAGRTDGEAITALEHFLLSDDRSVIESHTKLTRPLERDAMRFVAAVVRGNVGFDAEFYRANYPDLKQLDDEAASAHYYEHGHNEGRYGSARDMVQRLGLRIADIPVGFFVDEYLRLNPDLLRLYGADHVPLFRHYLEAGRGEKRKIGRWELQIETLDLNIPTPATPVRLRNSGARVEVCSLVHIFYADLWPELAAFVSNMRNLSHDLFVNVVDIGWSLKFQREMRQLCPGAFVQLSNDNGRDIGGFVRLLDNVDFDRYELFTFMHSKKSPHIAAEEGSYWRRTLLDAFAGNPQVAENCVRLFREDPTVGLIASKKWQGSDLGRNATHYSKLLDLFQVEEEHRNVEYVSGTMFMVRPDVVRRLHDGLKSLEFEYGGDKDLSFHVDGQIAHGVERLVGCLVRQLGYRIYWN